MKKGDGSAATGAPQRALQVQHNQAEVQMSFRSSKAFKQKFKQWCIAHDMTQEQTLRLGFAALCLMAEEKGGVEAVREILQENDSI